jgi:hypothetical protein
MLYCISAATIACGACPLFHQATPPVGDEKGDWLHSMLYCISATTTACGACPLFHQATPPVALQLRSLSESSRIPENSGGCGFIVDSFDGAVSRGIFEGQC